MGCKDRPIAGFREADVAGPSVPHALLQRDIHRAAFATPEFLREAIAGWAADDSEPLRGRRHRASVGADRAPPAFRPESEDSMDTPLRHFLEIRTSSWRR